MVATLAEVGVICGGEGKDEGGETGGGGVGEGVRVGEAMSVTVVKKERQEVKVGKRH